MHVLERNSNLLVDPLFGSWPTNHLYFWTCTLPTLLVLNPLLCIFLSKHSVALQTNGDDHMKWINLLLVLKIDSLWYVVAWFYFNCVVSFFEASLLTFIFQVFLHSKLKNFYCPVRISTWLWNLEFGPKNWNPKTVELFLRGVLTSRVDTSFRCNFSHFWTIFFALLMYFVYSTARLKSSKIPSHPTKIPQLDVRNYRVVL